MQLRSEVTLGREACREHHGIDVAVVVPGLVGPTGRMRPKCLDLVGEGPELAETIDDRGGLVIQTHAVADLLQSSESEGEAQFPEGQSVLRGTIEERRTGEDIEAQLAFVQQPSELVTVVHSSIEHQTGESCRVLQQAADAERECSHIAAKSLTAGERSGQPQVANPSAVCNSSAVISPSSGA